MGKRAWIIPAFANGLPSKANTHLCPSCKIAFDLHQPDVTRPNRMLGVCPKCRAWSVIDIGEDGQAKLTLVPESR